jgi:phytoene synthase
MTPGAVPVWEQPLLGRAFDAWRARAPASAASAARPDLLERAYARCEAVTAAHSRTFHLATRLLPRPKRRAMRALYAFCRTTDDLIDQPAADAAAALAAWRRRATAATPPRHDLVAVAWADTRARYGIPARCAEQLVDGVARDLDQRRYATFADLADYAYGVASTVGLMSMRIVGSAGEAAIPYAVELGVALQVTNILRDVGEDWRAGRLYLPLDELAAHGLGEADVAAGRVDGRWRAFMRFQIARNRRLYDEAWPGIGLLHRDGRLAVAAAGDLYRAILDDIEAHDYDVFRRRAHVGAWGKLRRLPRLWWHHR